MKIDIAATKADEQGHTSTVQPDHASGLEGR